MKKKELYVCEVCNTSYASKHDAQKCEENHVGIKSIVSCKYLPFNSDHTGCPQKITVETNDGRKIEYHR